MKEDQEYWSDEELNRKGGAKPEENLESVLNSV